jgi:prepilin-type N-terminal cleavage/methylation domain-containing protein
MQKLAGTKGFTLLEVLVALAVMAIAVTIVVQLFSVNLRTVTASKGMTMAVARAEARITEIVSAETLAEKVWSETTEEGYRIDVSISEILKDRTDNLPVKLLEVSLTTHWIEGRKEKSFKLKTVRMTDRETAT